MIDTETARTKNVWAVLVQCLGGSCADGRIIHIFLIYFFQQKSEKNLNLTKECDCMKQIIINYLFIVGLPIIVGLAVRILLQRFDKAYFATVVFAVLTIVGWVVVNVIPSNGSELYGILAIQTTITFVSSLLTGLVLRLKSKIISADGKETD